MCCGLKHIKKMLLTMNETSDTLSTQATTQTIYWKFGTTLLQINLKFVLRSLSRILDALVLLMNAIFFYSNDCLNLIYPLNS